MRRPLTWLGLPIAVLLVAGAHTPWIAQRVPGMLFPTAAAAGAALVVPSVLRSLLPLVQGRRARGRPRALSLAVNAAAMVFIVVLPLTHVVRAMAPSRDGTPRIHADFGDWLCAD